MCGLAGGRDATFFIVLGVFLSFALKSPKSCAEMAEGHRQRLHADTATFANAAFISNIHWDASTAWADRVEPLSIVYRRQGLVCNQKCFQRLVLTETALNASNSTHFHPV